jgi:hypothetical protein
MTTNDGCDAGAQGSVPASIGVPPDAPNATHADDADLADGPPATDEELDAHPTPGRDADEQ